jgi:hypothetical protein
MVRIVSQSGNPLRKQRGNLEAPSRVVLAPRGLAPSWRQCPAHCADDGGKRWFTRARISRKPLRREGRCDYRLYLWFTRSRNTSLRVGPGCSLHPAFPVPSAFSRGRSRCKTRAKRAARMRAYELLVAPLTLVMTEYAVENRIEKYPSVVPHEIFVSVFGAD